MPANTVNAHRAYAGATTAPARICAHHFERKLSKTLTCQFMGKLLVVITRPEQPRYALRSQAVKVIEHLSGELELLRGDEALPFMTVQKIP